MQGYSCSLVQSERPEGLRLIRAPRQCRSGLYICLSICTRVRGQQIANLITKLLCDSHGPTESLKTPLSRQEKRHPVIIFPSTAAYYVAYKQKAPLRLEND